MIQVGKRGVFAMGQAVPIRTDYAAGEVRRLAKRAKDGAQARRLLALAAVVDGGWREEAGRVSGGRSPNLLGGGIPVNEKGAVGPLKIPLPAAHPQAHRPA